MNKLERISAYPFTIFGNDVWIGYNATIGINRVKVLIAKNTKDAISGFILVQPNGKFTATKK